MLETLEASLQLGGAVLRQSGADWQDIEELIRELRFVDGIGKPIGSRPDVGEAIAEREDPMLVAARIVEEVEEAEGTAKEETETVATEGPMVERRAKAG